jgi:hypothetical protein
VKYVWCTRQGERARARLLLQNDPQALVEIQASEYSELNANSYVQCSRAFVKSISFFDLVNMLDREECQHVAALPQKLIERIVEGITNSNTFSTQDLKRLLD